MTTKIEIVDRGRGPQLSTSRITVQDLVPYLQDNWTDEQILDVHPYLNSEGLQVIKKYVQDHYDEVMEQDRRIRERAAKRVTPPEILESRRRGRAKMLALLEERFKNGPKENSGARSSP